MVKKEIANIYRITNGKIGSMSIKCELSNSRSCAEKAGNVIYWRTGNIGVLYHEAGHIFEFANQEHLAIAKRFIKDRATGKETRLSTLTGNRKYKGYEKAYPDNFSDPYVGKIYDDATEVLSMGLQILGNEEYFAKGLTDVGHLEFCFGCFNSEPVKKNNQIYNIEKNTRIYSNDIKRKDWEEAIDNAMSASFVQQLYGKGVERYKIIENDDGDLILKHNRTEIYTYYRSVEEDLGRTKEDRTRLARMAYLAICNFKGLVPDADPKLEKKVSVQGVALATSI